jgi:sugar lactone lactonase YvrE
MDITRRRSFRVLWVLGAILTTGPLWAAPATQPADYPKFLNDQSQPAMILDPDVTLTVQTTSLCQLQRKLDGQWMGNGMASDGKFYFGAASHSHDTAGMFLQYDPKTNKITVLSGDLTVTCGEDVKSITCGEPVKKMVPQGKIHTAILEHDGWLYFGTHTANYWKYAQDRFGGSHLLAYKLGSAEAGKPVFRDLGIVRENFTIYAGLALDPKNGYLYCSLTRWWNGGGGCIYRVKLDGSEKKEIAFFKNFQTFYMFLDQRGDLWTGDYGQDGTLLQVHGSDGKLTTYPNALPPRRSAVSDAPDQDPRFRNWGHVFAWGMRLDGDRCLISEHGDGALWEFDTTKVKEGDAKGAFRMVKWIGRHSAAITRAGDTLYFIQSANPKWSDTEHCADLHLKCTKLDANAPIVDLGRLVDPAGRTPNLVDCLAADAKGNVFTIGTWRIKPEEIGTDVSSYSHDAGSGDNKPFGQYYDMWRGLFFGTISAQMIHSAAAPATQPAAAASMPATKSVEVSTPGK